MRRRRTLRLRGGNSLMWLAVLLGASLCSLAPVAVSDDLVRTASGTNIPGVMLSLSLLAAVVQMRK